MPFFISVLRRYLIKNSSLVVAHINQVMHWLEKFLLENTNNPHAQYLERYIVAQYVGFGVLPEGGKVCVCVCMFGM